MFSSPASLESEDLQNSLLSPDFVSNVGLIDNIIDHQTIITDSKEDDYEFLVQWKDKPISDASWISSHDLLNYAPLLHSDFFLDMKATSSEMKSSNLGEIDGESLQHKDTRVPSEPRYDLRKRTNSKEQKQNMLLLIHKFEKLSIHEMNEKTPSQKTSTRGLSFPPFPLIY